MSVPRDAYLDPFSAFGAEPAPSQPGHHSLVNSGVAEINNAEVEELLVDLEELSTRETAANRFYPPLLDGLRLALNATTVSFWRRTGDGLFCETETAADRNPVDQDAAPPRPTPRQLMAVLAAGEAAATPLADRPGSPIALACPVMSAKRPIGLLVGVLPASAGKDPALLGVLAAFAELADQFELRHRLTTLEQDAQTAAATQAMSLDLQRAPNTRSATRIIAEEGRRLIGCDRLTVALRRGGRWRLAAMSGVERPSARSEAVRSVERLLDIATRTGDTVALREGGNADEHPPQLAEALQHYVDAGHARELLVVPCRAPDRLDRPAGVGPIEAVLLVEQFDGRLPERCEESTTLVAEQAAASVQRVCRTGRWRNGGLAVWAGRMVMATLVVAAIAGATAALVFTPAELRVAAHGRLVPSERARVFAPMDATVRRVLVEHGATVTAGQPLVELRSDTLEIDLEQSREALTTTRSEIVALRTAKLQAGLPGYQGETDLSAILSRIESLTEQTKHQQRRIDLLLQQQTQLTVRSPMAGRVVSWRPNDYLGDRPVRRGQRLLEIAAVTDEGDADDAWTIEIDLPDHRVGPVLTAAASADEPLKVDYVIKSDAASQRLAEVLRIAPVTQADAAGEPVVRIDARPVAGGPNPVANNSLRSGATVLAKIRCGQHPLGYVWFHEAWEAVQRAWF